MSVRQRRRRVQFHASAGSIAHAPDDLPLSFRHLIRLVSSSAAAAAFGVGTVRLTDVAVGHVTTVGGCVSDLQWGHTTGPLPRTGGQVTGSCGWETNTVNTYRTGGDVHHRHWMGRVRGSHDRSCVARTWNRTKGSHHAKKKQDGSKKVRMPEWNLLTINASHQQRWSELVSSTLISLSWSDGHGYLQYCLGRSVA